MKMQVTIGLDVSKEAARYHCLDLSGETLKKGTLARSGDGIEQLVVSLGDQPESLLVVAEATGMLHLGFCQRFLELGCQVVAMNLPR